MKKVLPAEAWTVRLASEPSDPAGGESAPEVVVIDGAIGGPTANALLGQLDERFPGAWRVLLVEEQAGHPDGMPVDASLVSKRLDDQSLREALVRALERKDLFEENRRLLALTLEQNERLAAQAHSLEEKVRERTGLLARAKDEWEKTFDAIERPIAILERRDLKVVRSNRAYAAMAGLPVTEVPGKLCHQVLFQAETPCEGCPLGRGEQASRHVELLAGERTFSMSSYETGDRVICIYRETTEERMFTRQAMQTEKLAAVGQLAAGVAHEINNPLGGILAFTQLMLRDEGRSPQDLETLQEVEQAALRCKRIVSSLLKFSRRQPAGKAIIDVNRVVDDVITLFRPQLKSRSRAVFHHELWPLPLKVNGDVNRIEQVLLALLVNALQALEDGAGNVALQTRENGDWVEIAVSDDGEGIPPENLKRLFEPTFTTKPPGENTGFGLAIAWSVAESHGGTIEVQSELGKGSTFTLKLPAAGSPETGGSSSGYSGA